jgi:hypothetical protein
MALLSRPGLRNAVLLVAGIAVGVTAAVGVPALMADDETPAALGRSADVDPATLLDPSRLAEVEGPRLRADSPREAVVAFLSAEQDGDTETSFGYLSDALRVEYTTPAAWTADHPDVLPPVVDFSVEGDPAADQQSARVEVATSMRYRSTLDPIVGLVPARAQASWTAVREDGGWAVDLAATTQRVVFPPDADATSAVQTWAEQQQSCADPQVYAGGLRGRTDLADMLCGSTGDVRAGAPQPLSQLDAPPLQSSFGADVVSWARVVPVDGPVPLRAVVAPVADRWLVIGVLSPTGAAS